MKRDASQVIWRTVVFSAAMLGAGAGCHKNKPAPTTPSNMTPAKNGDNGMAPTAKGSGATPGVDANGDPCEGGPDTRPRGTDDNGGGQGRGFVLS